MRNVPTLDDSKRVLAELLAALVHRHVPSPDELQALTGLSEGAIRDVLIGLERIGAIVTARGALVAAYPLSARPTAHVVSLGSDVPWANCAIDALAVPAMTGRRGTIRSTCAHCGAEITVDVDGKEVIEVRPAEIVVAYGGLANCVDRPSLESSCPYINFFCSLAHARAWHRPETWQGKVMPLREAVTLAIDRFRPIIEIYAQFQSAESSGR